MERKADRILLTYIAAPPGAVWALLTDPARSGEWFFGHRMDVGSEVGAPFAITRPDGSADVSGKVLAIDPPHRLMVSWRDTITGLPENEVEWLVDDVGKDGAAAARLTVREYHQVPVPEKWIKAGREGWSLILAGIKTILETGRPMPAVTMEPPQ